MLRVLCLFVVDSATLIINNLSYKPIRNSTDKGIVAKFEYLGSHSLRYPSKRGAWKVVFHIASVDGRKECVGIDVRSFDSDEEVEDPRPLLETRVENVSGPVLRRIPVADLLDQVREDLRSSLKSAGIEPDEIRILPSEEAGGRVGRPRTYSVKHYEAVAHVYLVSWKAGFPPTKAIQQHFDVSFSKAARWVREARKLGLIGPSPGRGKAGESRRKGGKK